VNNRLKRVQQKKKKKKKQTKAKRSEAKRSEAKRSEAKAKTKIKQYPSDRLVSEEVQPKFLLPTTSP
jgi:hypothetical protein